MLRYVNVKCKYVIETLHPGTDYFACENQVEKYHKVSSVIETLYPITSKKIRDMQM